MYNHAGTSKAVHVAEIVLFDAGRLCVVFTLHDLFDHNIAPRLKEGHCSA